MVNFSSEDISDFIYISRRFNVADDLEWAATPADRGRAPDVYRQAIHLAVAFLEKHGTTPDYPPNWGNVSIRIAEGGWIHAGNILRARVGG